MTKFQQEVLETIKRQGEQEIEWIAMLVGSSPQAVGRAITRLMEMNLVSLYDGKVGQV